MTGIKCNGYTLRSLSRFVDIIRQTLSCLSYRVNVHAVRPCPNDPSQTSGSKFEVHIKTLFFLILVICNVLKLFLRILIEIRIAQPLLVDVFVVHVFSSYQ